MSGSTARFLETKAGAPHAADALGRQYHLVYVYASQSRPRIVIRKSGVTSALHVRINRVNTGSTHIRECNAWPILAWPNTCWLSGCVSRRACPIHPSAGTRARAFCSLPLLDSTGPVQPTVTNVSHLLLRPARPTQGEKGCQAPQSEASAPIVGELVTRSASRMLPPRPRINPFNATLSSGKPATSPTQIARPLENGALEPATSTRNARRGPKCGISHHHSA